MNSPARPIRLIRPFRASFGQIGLALIILGQLTQTLQAGSVFLNVPKNRRGDSNPSGGTGTAATTANPTGAIPTTVAGGMTQAQAQALAKLQVADMARAAHSVFTQQSNAAAARNAALRATRVVPVTNGLTTLGTINPGLTPDSGLSINNKPVGNPSLNPGTSTTYDTPGSWTGIGGLSQTTASDGNTTVNINQTTQTAVLNWNSFNVGQKTTLQFNQNDASWIAFNKVSANAVPSQILGSIKAPGQVYVINPNGIIFGGASQVNVHNLTASTLPISDALINQGLLNNPNLQFLFSALDPANASQIPSSGKIGNIVVEAGASITSPTNSDNVGGRVALIAPQVENNGTILTPDGQTILAAGLEVGFIASTDASVRGLNPYVGRIADPSIIASGSGTVINRGLISAPRGNITLTGAAITQDGVLSATTSVAANGTINLLAVFNDFAVVNDGTTAYFAYGDTGSVTFKAGSLAEILPEYDSTETIAGQIVDGSPIAVPILALPSQMLVQAKTIDFESAGTDAGAQIIAPNAQISLQAGIPNLLGVDTLDFTDGGIHIGSNAIIDVAGSSNISASVADNIIAVQLLGAELADSPNQQNLKGDTIYIDLGRNGTNADGTTWIGTPLVNTLGHVNQVQYTVGELTTAGGTVAINSGGAVDLDANAVINVSGGYINYAGAEVTTTRLLTTFGQILDIAQASKDYFYTGIYTGSFTETNSHFGTSNTYTNPLQTGAYFADGYVKGGSGGTLTIQAPTVNLSGELSGNRIVGPRQLSPALLPTPSAFTLNIGQIANSAAIQSPGVNLFIQGANSPAPVAPTGFDTLENVTLTSDLVNQDGFGTITLNNSEGSITVQPGADLYSQSGGTIAMDASRITINADIIAPAGTLDFTVHQVSVFNPIVDGVPLPPTLDPNKGIFTLGKGVTLSTAGQIIDNRLGSPSANGLPMLVSGGAININAYSANLTDGILDVSGGLIANADGTFSFAGSQGGSIDVEAGQDPSVLYKSVTGGTLQIKNTNFSGYSGLKGGSLTLKAPAVQVGGTAPANSSTLWLQPGFFSQGGFASFTMKGIGLLGTQQTPAVLIADGTAINPIVKTWRASYNANQELVLSKVILPSGLRTGASLSFDALGIIDSFQIQPVSLLRGDMVMGAGSSIVTDPLGSVTLSGDTVTVHGNISTPGGTITIAGDTDTTSLQNNNLNVPYTATLGADSVLSATGAVRQIFDKYGHLIGPVVDGGKISITGDILAESGAKLDVSGTVGVLTLPRASSNTPQTSYFLTPSDDGYIPTTVYSNGGSITLANGQQAMSFSGDITAYAGGLSASGGSSPAHGGSLTVSSQRQPTTQPLPSDITLVITPTGDTAGTTAGLSTFAASSFNDRGFDALTLKGNVEFSGGVSTLSANASLTVATGGFLTVDSGSTANLIAPYVMLGQAFIPPTAITPLSAFTFSDGLPYFLAPVSGTGILNVTASDLIDLGNLSLQGINLATFNSQNDIRGDGTIDIAGSIHLEAGQIYAPTATAFSIVAYDSASGAGSVQITNNGNVRSLPYSAGSTLTILASNIVQDGVLRAPFGIINLGWNGTGTAPLSLDLISGLSGNSLPVTSTLTLGADSVTSVSAIDPISGQALTIPYGVILNGTSWIDPKGNDITLTGPPAKAVNLSAQTITDSSGAQVDIRGGGDLYAYQFVSGTGGSADFLAPSTATFAQGSFAIIPSYGADYAPDAGYNTSSTVAANFATTVSDGGNGNVTQATDLGYTDSALKVGDRVYLSGNGIAAGYYTLLPARYALLPGAFLVTPKSSSPTPFNATITQANGSNLVSGYRYNNLSSTRSGQPLYTSFEIDPSSVVRARGQYNNSYANDFFAAAATSHSLVAPRLPGDSGQLVLNATSSLNLQPRASVLSVPLSSTGLGGLVDIATSKDIYLYGSGQSGHLVDDALNLSVDELNSFGAASLLIGGIRTTGTSGTSVAITTGNITIDNAGDALVGPEIILVTAPADASSGSNLILSAGAEIRQKGVLSGSGGSTLLIGDSTNPGSGNGNVLWVTSNAAAQVVRSGVSTPTTAPVLSLGAGAIIGAIGQNGATSAIFDSTGQTLIDPTATIQARNTTLGGSQITLLLSGTAPTTGGLVLTAQQLKDLTTSGSGGSLTLSSQSSIDIQGSGDIGSVDASGAYSLSNLFLRAAQINNVANDSGSVAFRAGTITLDNSPNGSVTAPAAGIPSGGTISFNADAINLGINSLQVTGYKDTQLTTHELFIQGMGNLPSSAVTTVTPSGTFSTSGNLTITTPLITVRPTPSSLASIEITPSSDLTTTQTISAGGALKLVAPANETASTGTRGLGASLALIGASVSDNTTIQLPSGTVTIQATSGDIRIGDQNTTLLDVGGAKVAYSDATVYTSGGLVRLLADKGDVVVGNSATITVAAQAEGGNAGILAAQAANGTFTNTGTLHGAGGAAINGVAGTNGTFVLDVGHLATDFGTLDSSLGEFTGALTVRTRTGNIVVNNTVKSLAVSLSADAGSITVGVGGTIDASGTTGGSIALASSGDVNILGTLTVAGKTFDSAGKGGSITLHSGTSRVVNGTVTAGSGQINVAAGSNLNLGVEANTSASGAQGKFTGTLTLIAPQLDANGHVIAANNPDGATPTDIAITHLDGTITGASSIAIVGNQLYQPADGQIDNVRDLVFANGTSFLGEAGSTTSAYDAIYSRLLGNQSAAIQAIANIEIGAEIVNPTGSLTLGSTTPDTTNDWDLSTFRFGPNGAPGLLTIRAAGNLIFDNALSDGFDADGVSVLRNESVSSASSTLPINNQSWSYHLVAGSDLSAADYHQVLSQSALVALNPDYNVKQFGPQGSLQLGKPNGGGSVPLSKLDSDYFQVIRTGTGDIDIATGGSLQLLNPIASIYTTGVQAPDINNFNTPTYTNVDGTVMTAQYTYAGGNVTIDAQLNIQHVAQTPVGQPIDTQRELPTNWLDRRGTPGDDNSTVTWWVDFSNFFEGVAALGGGNVSLTAGNNITNVDALIPTNARMPSNGTKASDLVELGGGDLLVRAGNNIDGSVFYLERGQGTLVAGNSITTNTKRQPSSQLGAPLPVTLFLGKGGYDIRAGGTINLGPIANPFLLPQSANNSVDDTTFFSTYGTQDAVNVTALNGAVTLAESTDQNTFLTAWYSFVDLDSPQPWLLINEDITTIVNYQTASGLLPGTLRVNALTNDIDIIGNLTLSPSPTGTLELLAGGSINALQPLQGSGIQTWTSSTINLSDADPTALPGILNPVLVSDPDVNGLNDLLIETGSTDGNLQFKASLHTPGGLHTDDLSPVRLYAAEDISGLTLFSGKLTHVLAGEDLTDVALYIQNLHSTDISIVSAGRDIIAYDPNSPLQTLANVIQPDGTSNQFQDYVVQTGDIQISGPGTLEVLSGRHLTLGNGPDNGDGTGLGITSIGNQRNPYLGEAGAALVTGAGIALPGLPGAIELSKSAADFNTFIAQFLTPDTAEGSLYLPGVGTALGVPTGTSDAEIYALFSALPEEQRDNLALSVFYQVLSDSGNAFNNPASSTFGSYKTGEQAIAALFPVIQAGDITLSSREIKTENGGGISIFAPGGSLNLGLDITKPSADQGILTNEGGAINVFTGSDVNLGASRIFTLRGGDVTIWSARGNIAAGASSKTVQAAPPTRVIIDPQTANVKTDVAGLATGGGIGVLQSKATSVASNVNLIAPLGTVDAGDAGIRVSGNLNIAALHIANAANISVGGASSGVPAGSSVNVGGLTSASNVAGAANSAAQKLANTGPSSDISVQVIGYGGDDEDDDEKKKDNSGT